MRKKLKFLKFSSLGIFSLSLAMTAVSCSEYNSLQSASNFYENDYPTFSNLLTGTVPASLNNLNDSAPTDFSYSYANNYNLLQNYKEFRANNDINKYEGNQSEIVKDVSYFAYLLWRQNAKSFTIENVEVNNFEIKDANNLNIILGKSKISFDLKISIKGIQVSQLKIFDKVFELLPGKKYSLEISVKDQVFESTVNTSVDEFFIGWKVNNSTIKFGNESFDSEFSPTNGSFSFAFPYKIKGLTSKQNYLDIYSKYQPEILNISQQNLINDISEKFNEDFQTYMEYVENGMGILNILRNNPTVKDLILNSIPYIAKIMVSAKVIPEILSPLIIAAFEPGNEAKPFIEIVQEYKGSVVEYLNSVFGPVSVVAETYLNLFKPNMVSDSNDFKSLETGLKSFGISSDIMNLIYNDIIGLDGKTPKKLIDIIYDNVDIFLKIIEQDYEAQSKNDNNSDSTTSTSSSGNTSSTITETTTSENDSTQAVLNIIKLIFSKNTETDQYNKFFDILSGDEKTEFYNSLAALAAGTNSQIGNILNLITTSNEKFTTENVISFVDALYNFLKNLFERNDNYEHFYLPNAYKNVSFTTGFTTLPTVDKSNQTISFNYQIKMTINKKVDASPIIAAFKNLLSVDSISSLINLFTGTDLKKIVGEIPVIGKFAEERIISAILQIIPTNFWLGANPGEKYYKSNAITFTYSADNSSFWLKPVRILNDYKLGYQFAYNTNLKIDDPSFTNSITSNYSYKNNSISLANINLPFGSDWNLSTDISVDFYYYNFWYSLIQNVVLRDYDFSNLFVSKSINYDTIATISTYNPDLYVTDLTIEDTFKNIDINQLVSTYSPTDTKNYRNVYSEFVSPGSLYSWKDGMGGKSMLGIKPIVSDELKNSLLDKVYKFNSNQFNKIFNNSNLKIDNYVIPTLNFNAPLKIYQKDYGVNVEFNMRFLTVEFISYFPFSVYNLTKKSYENNFYYQFSYIGSVDNAQK